MFNEVRSALKMLAKHDLDKLIASVSITSLPFRSAAQVPLACRLRPPDPGEIIDPNRYTHNTDVAAPQYRQKSARSAGFPEECIVDVVADHFRRESCP
jgi:hypothetical protein